ncbi:hypothetical protein CMV_006730 [Castanea mollissima]|uniref:Uncharacterized protein n=1 Tax=Castanea mollissima TaxID=60419 RepID=A0A8J4RB41_9ROSI|nr:hypothetical protein CMV_006730 [Castanea mollissima]
MFQARHSGSGVCNHLCIFMVASRSCFYEPLKEVQKHKEEMDSEAIYINFVLQGSPFFKFNSSSKCLHSKLEMMAFNHTGHGSKKSRKPQPSHDRVPQEGDDSSDMDMDEKSRGGSFEVYSASGSSRGDIIALSSSEERDSVEKDVPNSQSLSGAAEGTSGGSDYEEKIISSQEANLDEFTSGSNPGQTINWPETWADSSNALPSETELEEKKNVRVKDYSLKQNLLTQLPKHNIEQKKLLETKETKRERKKRWSHRLEPSTEAAWSRRSRRRNWRLFVSALASAVVEGLSSGDGWASRRLVGRWVSRRLAAGDGWASRRLVAAVAGSVGLCFFFFFFFFFF